MTDDLVRIIGKIAEAMESMARLDDSRYESLRRELAEVRLSIGAITEQMVVESDLIGATQDYALRSELSDLRAEIMAEVREAVATPFDSER